MPTMAISTGISFRPKAGRYCGDHQHPIKHGAALSGMCAMLGCVGEHQHLNALEKGIADGAGHIASGATDFIEPDTDCRC